LDFWLQEQYLPDACDVQIKLTRNAPSFCCQVAKGVTDYPKVKILRAELWLRKVSPSPSVIAGHMAGLSKMNAVWPYNAHKIITSHHQKGATNISIADCCQGIFPKCMIVGMLDTDAYNGSWGTSPFNFQHFNVSEIGTMINGQHIPQQPYTPDFANKNVAREYLCLTMMLGREFSTNTIGLTLADYLDGYTFFAFNYAPDLMLTGHGHPARLGNIHLNIKFLKALEQNITILLFCVYDTQIELTGQGNVILDPTQTAN
jgi:hypothetical protein